MAAGSHHANVPHGVAYTIDVRENTTTRDVTFGEMSGALEFVRWGKKKTTMGGVVSEIPLALNCAKGQ